MQLLIVFGLLILSSVLEAKIFYLAPNGQDSNNCGSYSSPCKSIKRALKTSKGVWRAKPGDQILLKGGRYVVNYPLYDQFYVDEFFARADDCLNPSPENSLYIGIDPNAAADVVIEMGQSFADPLQNPSKRGSLIRINESSCIIVDGHNGNGKRLIIDGKWRPFGLSNGFYDAFNGGPIPPSSTPQPPSSGLVHLTDYSGQTANLPTNQLIYGGMIIANLEVKNTFGVGISLNKQRNITIMSNYVHHTFFRAIGGYGYEVGIINNQVDNAALINLNNIMFYAKNGSGGWPGVVQMSGDYEFKELHPRSEYINIENNVVKNSWGEGIIANADFGQVTDNLVANAYSVGIYLEHAQNIKALRNYTYANDALYHRPTSASPYVPPSSTPDSLMRAMDGITLATEGGENNGDSLVRDVKMANNIMVGTRRGLTYWFDSSNTSLTNSYSNINFSHNVIIANVEPIKIFKLGANVERHANNHIYNNIIERSSQGLGLSLGDIELWDVQGNYLFNFQSYAEAGLLGPNFNAGSAPENFRATPNGEAYFVPTVSPSQTNVLDDFFEVPRGQNPIAGAFE